MEANQEELVEVIQGLHDELRYRVQKEPEDYMAIWKDHSMDSGDEAKTRYASAMHSLATKVWIRKERADDRIAITHAEIEDYYRDGGFERVMRRMFRKHSRVEDVEAVIEPLKDFELNENEKLRLLDVGSCYNPFSKFDYDITAVDLSPATPDVIQCDFVTVNFSSKLNVVCTPSTPARKIDTLPKGYFHVVVFCLLLEYLPDARLRLRAVHNAYKALKDNGLLVVITPDSKHAQKNMSMIQGWRRTLLRLGLDRVRYSKHQHLHCISFRKLCPVSRHLMQLDAQPCKHSYEELCSNCVDELAPQMSIHQDRQDYVAKFEGGDSAVQTELRGEDEDESIAEMLAEMPLEFEDDDND
ncbi:probable methyltransferase BMT2 homolog [Varroa jacobsoni]|uniref:probable methyltransferase BMT2 homolog n=1 Tax=Varroa jacobsoni TaxID=62625 RepID=UPI000BF53ACA|nr:probable methyltransferase BMT2 homolog [Varroa jacobsoni]